MFLTQDQFTQVVAYTPLISIDFIVRNPAGQVLLGRRTNKPAQGYWFVPGGRIFKDEIIEHAFMRIGRAELGVPLSIDQGRFLGVYEHFYKDSTFDDFLSTHYVVLAFEISSEFDLMELPLSQHVTFRWFEVEYLMSSESVHHNTKAYFDTRNPDGFTNA